LNRNLITRMGVASGVVAALVATVFAVLFNEVGAQRHAADEAQRALDVATAGIQLRRLVDQVDVATRARLAGDVVRAKAELAPLRRAQVALARGDAGRTARAQTIDRDIQAFLSGPSTQPGKATTGRAGALLARLRTELDAVVKREQARAAADHRHAHTIATRAIALGIGGLIGSALLILLLTTYLTQYIIVPLRRVGRAARKLAAGDLSARVVEEGDAEPVELARSFNTMASTLQASQAALEEQNTELAAQQSELETALDELAAEKRRVEIFYRAGEQLAAELDLDALADIALRELSDAAGAEGGALWAATQGEDSPLRLVASRGLSEQTLPAELGPSDGLAGRALAETRTVTARHEETALRVHSLGRDLAVRYEANVPLRLGERVVAVISLGRLDPDPFEAERLETVERLADQAAVAFANVLSYGTAVRQARINAAVLAATPDPIGLYGPDGAVIVQNGPMAELGGEATAPPGDPGGEVLDEVVLSGRTLTRYGAPVHDATGRLMGRIVVLRDVTAERESERLKDEFFALVSHELRTPLTSIIGYLELVIDDEEELSADARRFLEVVERNATRLLRLVGDMLFVAQVEAGRLSLERSAVDLALVASESVEAARPSAERGDVELALEADQVPLVTGDRDRFGQMLDNLVSNAVKFTPPGGRVLVRLTGGDDGTVLSVTDTGPGIPAADQEHLFERFYRSSHATAAAIPGIGLGLTIVKTIAELHGGRVRVESREGEGTTVRVELPHVSTAAAIGGSRS